MPPVKSESTPSYIVLDIKKLVAKAYAGDYSGYPEVSVYSDGSAVSSSALQPLGVNTFDIKRLTTALNSIALSSLHDTCTYQPSHYMGEEDMTYYKRPALSANSYDVTIPRVTPILVKSIDCYIAANPNTELAAQLGNILQKSNLGTN